MGENSHISWTDHTVNFFIGCTKVSPGCKSCYAEVDTFARRERSHGRELWGPSAERHRTSAALWEKPYTWNENHEWVECHDCGWRGPMKKTIQNDGCLTPECNGWFKTTRQRVFVNSMSDICEVHPMITDDMLDEIAKIVIECSNLDFLFLTKRIENFNARWLHRFGGKLPDNLWVGTSVENQEYADKRIPELLKVPAKIRFLSCEPLIGSVNLTALFSSNPVYKWNVLEDGKIHWVIAGGESQAKARPMHPDWVRQLRDHCKEFGVAFHFKQWGEFKPIGEEQAGGYYMDLARQTGMLREGVFSSDGYVYEKVGKKNSGRLLDGKEYNEFPK